MEFRCPACDTSYRVPVRIDQQVRCARCNHVWRIAETDFVIADTTPDDSEMPEGFSQTEPDDRRDEAGLGDMRESLSSIFERPQAWRETPPQHDSAHDANGEDDQADDDLPGSRWEGAPFASSASLAGNEAQAQAGESASWSAAGTRAVVADEQTPQHAPEDDTDNTAAAVRAAFARDESTLGEAQEISPDKEIADNWFGSAANRDDAEEQQEEQAHNPAASFERIMEGIEEVIAESGAETRGLAAASAAEPKGGESDPFSALMRDDRRGESSANGAGSERGDAAVGEAVQPQGAKVVQFTAPRPDHRLSEANQHSDDPYAREPEDADTGYYDPDHEAAQMDSLAFSGDREAFETDHSEADDWTQDAESGQDVHHDAYAARSAHYLDDDAPAHDNDRAAAGRDESEDDELLAEYDFGDDALEETAPPMAAPQRSRRVAGALTVAAAWMLFLAVLAGSGWSAISFRERVVETLPASATVYSAIGFPVTETPLALEDVSYALKGEPPNVLSLSGRVKHTGDELIEMPDLKITVRDEADQTILEDSRFLGQAALLPGETMEFSVDLEVPAERLRTVELEF